MDDTCKTREGSTVDPHPGSQMAIGRFLGFVPVGSEQEGAVREVFRLPAQAVLVIRLQHRGGRRRRRAKGANRTGEASV